MVGVGKVVVVMVLSTVLMVLPNILPLGGMVSITRMQQNSLQTS